MVLNIQIILIVTKLCSITLTELWILLILIKSFSNLEKFFSYIKAERPPLGLLSIKDPQTIKTTNINLKDKNIFIYTDGVTEGYIEGEKEFTVKGVEDEVLKNSSLDIKEIIDRITNKLNNREKLRDDITMMGLQ